MPEDHGHLAFLNRKNIERFELQLVTSQDEAQRAMLTTLLVEEREKEKVLGPELPSDKMPISFP
jgi:hypothetical protein